MAFVRTRIFIAAVAALLGAGLVIGSEIATQWSPVTHVASTSLTPACTELRPNPSNRFELCVEPVPLSAADDFIRSVLAAFVGGLLGVGTFVAGQISVRHREARSGRVAVRLIRKELQANRLAMNNALTPIPAGVSPIPERITISIFPTVQIELADRLPYDLFTKTSVLYSRLAELATKDLRDVDPKTIELLREGNESLDEALRPYDIN
jgi:hypothetical protein